MLNSDSQKLSVTGLVTLYELYATNIGTGVDVTDELPVMPNDIQTEEVAKSDK